MFRPDQNSLEMFRTPIRLPIFFHSRPLVAVHGLHAFVGCILPGARMAQPGVQGMFAHPGDPDHEYRGRKDELLRTKGEKKSAKYRSGSKSSSARDTSTNNIMTENLLLK